MKLDQAITRQFRSNPPPQHHLDRGFLFEQCSSKENINTIQPLQLLAAKILGECINSPHDQHVDVDREDKPSGAVDKRGKGCSII